MNQDDYAIIIGIQDYPGIDKQAALSGTENDARAFYDWVVSPDGGGVPNGQNGMPDHVELILSSDYHPPFKSISRAQPMVIDVQNAFIDLETAFRENGFNKIGRRLYIYMAGHGISPNQGGGKNEREAALLMANVVLTNASSNVSATFHVLGAYTADWFSLNECFDEVFLFMDCCREEAFVMGLNEFLPRSAGTPNAARRYYAFATKWSRLSRERPMPDENGKVRGVFTKTLLLGLAGAAADPDPTDPTLGVITGASLKSFLYNNMSELLDPELQTERSNWEPEVVSLPDSPQAGSDLIIKKVPLPTFPVVVHIPAGATGDLLIHNGQFAIIDKRPINVAPVDIQFNLARGSYLAVVAINGNSTAKKIDVKGIVGLAEKGGVDVNF